MKKKLIVSLTGIAMSMAIAATGCASATGTAGEQVSSTKSAVQAEISSGEAEQAAETADQTTESAGAVAENGASEKHRKQKPSHEQNDGQESSDAAAELTTVEPSAYAGQTVCGKVTAIDGAQVTVSLGTISQKSKSSGAPKAPAEGAPAEGESTGAETSGSAQNLSTKTGNASVIQLTNEGEASGTDSTTSATPKAERKNGHKKKSPFKANGEQMTVTIPEGLTDTEIKEGSVLSITLDEAGNVSAVEVKLTGRSKPQDGSRPKNSGGSQNSSNSQDSSGLQNS